LNLLSLSDPLGPLIARRIQELTGSSASLEPFAQAQGDPGLLGPHSVAWRVHAHFTAMMVGGLSSLLVQSLHPRALAAVWDHSDFQQQLKPRLGRTAYFVACTTYGPTELALAAIDRVNRIHAQIKGHDRQGLPYVANAPDLIRWVHLAEVQAFLNAYQHLSPSPLRPSACDQYMAEMCRIGHRLGAHYLPTTCAGVDDALEAYQPELAWDDRSREIWRVVQAYPVEPLDRPFMQWVLGAALDLLPPWARTLADLGPRVPWQVQARRRALQALNWPIQRHLDQHGVAAISRRRFEA
jgi:uncharacterized protein (DUF2236 family)